MKSLFLALSILVVGTLKAQQSVDIKSMVDSLRYCKGNDSTDDCNDLYMRLVAQGQKAIPYLMDKLTDTTRTQLYNGCKKGNLEVGEMAYFIMEEIGDFPAMVVTGIQMDVLYPCCCMTGLIMDDSRKAFYQEKAKAFYAKAKFKWVKIKPSELSPCQKKYHITGHYEYVD